MKPQLARIAGQSARIANTRQTPTAPAIMCSRCGSRRRSRSRVVDRCASHIPSIYRVLEWGCAVHRTTVVPDDEVSPLSPRKGSDKARLCCEVDQLLQELTSLLERPSDDVG